MRFEWDEQKNRQNLKKHNVRFETAALIFDDPALLTERELSVEGEERWNTLGSVAPGVVLFVAHNMVRTGRRRGDAHYFSPRGRIP